MCIVTLVPHNHVYCFVEILPWMLHCTLEPLPPLFIVLLNYYDLLYCIVELLYCIVEQVLCCTVELLAQVFYCIVELLAQVFYCTVELLPQVL